MYLPAHTNTSIPYSHFEFIGNLVYISSEGVAVAPYSFLGLATIILEPPLIFVGSYPENHIMLKQVVLVYTCGQNCGHT